MKMTTNNIPQGYKDSPLGIIPEEWEVKKLREIAEINPTRKDFISPFVTFLSMADISEHGGILKENIVPQNSIKPGLTSFKRGDIIIAKITPCFENGKGALLNNITNEYGFGSTEFHVIRCKQCNLFIYYHTMSYAFRKRLESQMTGSAGQKRVPADSISSYKIPVPPLPEQQKIAEVLSTWDKAIEKQSRLIEKLELRKKGLMQQLLTGKKRLPGFNIPWKKIKLGEMGNTYNGLSGKNKDDFEQGNAKFIPYINVFSNEKIDVNNLQCVKINPEDQQNMVKYGDIFFTVSSETPDEVGMASVLLEHLDNTYLNSFCFGYRLKDFSTLSPFFAAYLFRTEHFRHYMNILAQGSTRFNLSKKEVMKLRINIPVIKEQITIYKVLNTADREIELAQQKLDILRQQKHGLMQQLLTGKKRVKYEN